MFLDILAVLLLTFLSALGLITVSDWIMGKAFCNRIYALPFLVVGISSVGESEVEGSVRYLISDERFSPSRIFLDCRDASETAVEICRKLEKRFGCAVFENENELSELIVQSLQLR